MPRTSGIGVRSCAPFVIGSLFVKQKKDCSEVLARMLSDPDFSRIPLVRGFPQIAEESCGLGRQAETPPRCSIQANEALQVLRRTATLDRYSEPAGPYQIAAKILAQLSFESAGADRQIKLPVDEAVVRLPRRTRRYSANL